MKRLCTICARGGSKGVPGKNVRPLAGKPLIVHSIEQARDSGLFDLLAVSSDSEQILRVCRDAGVEMLIDRPPEMATDQAGKLPAIRHCVAAVEERTDETYDVLVDLSATSPLRLPEDIRQAVALLEERWVSNVITGSPSSHSPYFNLVERDAEGFVHLSKRPAEPILRRQDSPACFDMNGSIYVWRRDVFMAEQAVFYDDTLLHAMPDERSQDIDTELDFTIIELLMARRGEV